MRKAIRGLGWLFLLLAVALLLIGLWPLATGGEITLDATGAIWFRLHPDSLNALQAGIERNIDPKLWDGVIFPLLKLPAFLPPLVLGGMLLLFTHQKRRRFKR